MNTKELLDYVKENANDVSDLAAVDTVEKSEAGDPWRNVLISELREKYEDEALEDDRAELLEDWI